MSSQRPATDDVQGGQPTRPLTLTVRTTVVTPGLAIVIRTEMRLPRSVRVSRSLALVALRIALLPARHW